MEKATSTPKLEEHFEEILELTLLGEAIRSRFALCADTTHRGNHRKFESEL